MAEYRRVLKSELKNSILLNLLNGSRKLSDIKFDTESSETTILHALKELEELTLTKKNAGLYELTSIGKIQAEINSQYYKTTEIIEKFKEFWLAHDVNCIPPRLISQLGLLEKANLIKTSNSELGKVHENFLQILIESKKIKGLSPIFHSDFIRALHSNLANGGTVELVVTDDVLEKILQTAKAIGESEHFNNYLLNQQLGIYLIDELKIALTITENMFSMGLSYPNGEYDYNNDLVSMHPSALQWGEEIFQEYLKQSRKIQP